MTRSETKRLIAATAFAGLLLLAIAGWAWVLARTLENERRVASAELEANQQKLLDRVARELEEALRKSDEEIIRTFEEAGSGEKAYFSVIRRKLASGLIYKPADPRVPFQVPNLDKWGERGAERIGEAIRTEKLSWGLDEEGRDPLASLAADLLERTPDPLLSQLLQQRLLDDSVALKPSFRLFLLERGPLADKWLVNAENLRAADGDVLAAPGFENAEIETLQAGARELRIYRTPEDLAGLVHGLPDGMKLGTAEGTAGYVKRVAGLEKRPFLQFSASPRWFGKIDRMLGIIGTASGILLVSLLLAGIAFGLRETKTARSRMDLAASVAHELRTPLAGQRLVLESLANEPGHETKHREYIAMALRENKRLCHLAEEFLTFTRLERGGASPHREPVILRDVFQRAVELMGEQLEKCDFAMETDDHLTVSGDPEELSTVIRNLVENAWKYSDGVPWVRLRARTDGDTVVLEVEDHGRGIARCDHARIFQQFHRGDRTLARRSDGIGLGLAIVRRIVEAHHGSIEVISEPGRGSLFRIHFPIES